MGIEDRRRNTCISLPLLLRRFPAQLSLNLPLFADVSQAATMGTLCIVLSVDTTKARLHFDLVRLACKWLRSSSPDSLPIVSPFSCVYWLQTPACIRDPCPDFSLWDVQLKHQLEKKKK